MPSGANTAMVANNPINTTTSPLFTAVFIESLLSLLLAPTSQPESPGQQLNLSAIGGIALLALGSNGELPRMQLSWRMTSMSFKCQYKISSCSLEQSSSELPPSYNRSTFTCPLSKSSTCA